MSGLTLRRPAAFQEFLKESINQGIHQRFEQQVELHRSRLAIKTQNQAFTYAEANAFANSVAEEILTARGKKLEQAAILLPNTPEMVLSMLGALKAHKAYVPLDHHFPRERLKAMLEHSEAKVLVTDDQHLPLAEELCGTQVPIINVSQIKRRPDAPNPQVPCDPVDRAYILYTSGSTGRPKGISFLHRNLLHTTMCLTNKLFFSPGDRVTWLHSASFAASVVDIYCCLTNGATLFPWDVKARGFTGLADWLVEEKITTLQWIPSAFRQFLRTVPGDFIFNDIRLVVMASESLTKREVDAFRQHFPPESVLVNQVGTSESYNYCLYPIDQGTLIEKASVPGGYSVSPDRQVVILDDDRHEVTCGAVGEIGVKSDYMSAGYWRDEKLTRSKFVKVGQDNTPVFLTGDLGKLEPDGCLMHLGRKDSQVKIRGNRVELVEIEQVLTTAPGVTDAVTRVIKNQLGEDQLVGYALLRNHEFNQDEVEQYLKARLPDYMVPRHYVVLSSFPILPTGKVDREGLPNPFSELERGTNVETAHQPDPLEQETVSLFKELLQSEDITKDSRFLRSGGDSLLTAILIHRIHERFKVELRFDQMAEPITPLYLATLIRSILDGGATGPAYRPPSSRTAVQPFPRALPTSGFRITRYNKAAALVSSRVKNLIIIGAGEFGREIFTWAMQATASGLPVRIKGFLDRRGGALDGYDYPVKVLGTVENYVIEKDDVFIGAIGDPKTKVTCYSPIIERGGEFINIIHPLANVGSNVQLGVGIVLGPFSSVTCDARIGHHVSIGAFSNAGHDTVIGDWSQISSHCGINGGASLGEGVFLGSHACIIPKAKVGSWAFIGAGSVVVRDVAPEARVFGNPAQPIQQGSRSQNKKSELTILISSAGRRVELIRCFQSDAKALGLNLRMIAVDVEPEMSSACQAADACFRVPPCTSPDFLAHMLQICEQEKVSLLVPTIDLALLIYAEQRQQFAAVGTRVLVSDPALVRMARDKAATSEFLKNHGIPVPRTARLNELLEKPDNWPWPLILKPAHGSASVGICTVTNIDEAKEAAARRDDYVAQELVEGVEYTVNLYFDQAGKLRSAVPHERYEIRAGEVSKGSTRREPRLMDLASRLGAVLKGAVGSLCFQAILPESGQPAVFEINARFGGGYPLAHQAGARFTRWLLEETVGLPCSANEHWDEGVTMLRYDAAIFRRMAMKT